VLVVPVVRVVVWIGGRVLVTWVVVVVWGGGGAFVVVCGGAELVTGGAVVVTGATAVVVTVCELVVEVLVFVTLRLWVTLCVALLWVLEVTVAEASGAYVVPVLRPPELLPHAATATARTTPEAAAVIVTNARFIAPCSCPWSNNCPVQTTRRPSSRLGIISTEATVVDEGTWYLAEPAGRAVISAASGGTGDVNRIGTGRNRAISRGTAEVTAWPR
jgi:hypothetical protein